jgi:hypothetical protein
MHQKEIQRPVEKLTHMKGGSNSGYITETQSK